ncbi:hypothetical protein Ait01nite_013470 [Actinoplanes italicus]|uniref:Peptidase inhibitor family I36 n=1 Tax=Actinoplanes italicus TaxID=113567 RepID=A0A2T0KH62_9ACTN|nr:hypothetical protein [Actinoplanes italicus]PRX22779.1 hypothetical protein CLV67_104307 [Actinoplanes italicus]GIE28302.1 hypothetical protein Ait01nite_013470 [Actinoplanes italicus]
MNARSRMAAIAGTLVFALVPSVPAGAAAGPGPWDYVGASYRKCDTHAASPQIEQGSTKEIFVTNNTSARIFAYWRNWKGEQEIPRYIDPGETTLVFYSDNGDIVEIGDNYMNCLAMFVINTSTGEAEITYN